MRRSASSGPAARRQPLASGARSLTGGTVAFDVVYTLGSSASSPNPSRARPTTTCSPSPGAPRRSASTPSSAATTTCVMGRRRAACPGPTDAWITLAGLARDTSTIRLGTLVTPATFRTPRRAGDQRRQGRPDERRPRRARPRRGLVRGGARGLRVPVPVDSASASTVSPSSWRSSPDCGRPARASVSTSPAQHVVLHDSPAPPQAGAAAGADHRRRRRAARGRRSWPPASPPSSTCRSARSSSSSSNEAGWSTACAAIGRDPATLVFSTALTACGRHDRGRGVAPGGGESQLARASAPYRRRRDDRRGGRNDAEVAGCRRRADVSAGARPR